MLGAIKFEDFEGLTSMPQDAATAWTAAENGWAGSSFKPLLFVGRQITRGVNYHFIAEETLVTNPPERHIVEVEINSFGGRYVISSIETLIA